MPFAIQRRHMSFVTSSAQTLRCKHCQTLVPAESAPRGFCCSGCEAVYRLLNEEGLTRYYALGGGVDTPVTTAPTKRAHAWLEPLFQKAESEAGCCSLELDVQGIHCAACVWLMNELFRREAGGVSIIVNPSLGKVRLSWRRGELELEGYVQRVERFGYQFGPSRKSAAKASSELPLRLGICVALAMNVMLFQVSFYVGLAPSDGELFTLFSRLSLALSSAVVAIGGWPFFRAAYQGLRTRVLHLDLPIALGILLVYGVSLVQARSGRGDLAYFDTLNTFITLMLVGRWLQQRVLERNRRFLLEDDGADGFMVRRRSGSAVEIVRASRIARGDLLLIAPGELVPTDSELTSDSARVSTDWITGESAARHVARGGAIPAGSFNSGNAAIEILSHTDFRDSPIVALLRQPAPKSASQSGVFWSRLARAWSFGVLTLSAAGFLLWLPKGHTAAIEVAVALLVVTCPCAIGIAIPLAYELAQARLRRSGFFVRSGDLLDRLLRVRTIFFDKTGTLTLGRPELSNFAELDTLSPELRDAAFNLAVRSSHPVSACIAEALLQRGARFDPSFQTIEEPGRGLFARVGPVIWRLGRAEWAVTGAAPEPRTLLSRNGTRCFAFSVKDSVRRDAKSEIAELRRNGHPVWLLSGDTDARAKELAAELGVPSERALGGRSPEEKAEVVSREDGAGSLYLGDGVNDSLAFQAALCAGTPAIDRPVMPGRSDFFLLGEGLRSLREALSTAQILRATVRRIVGISLAYNVVAVTACLGGFMSPLRAALVMPLSSLSILLFTVAALRGSGTTSKARARTLQEAAA